MVEAIATTSLVAYRPLYGVCGIRDVGGRGKLVGSCRFPRMGMMGGRVVFNQPSARKGIERVGNMGSMKVIAMELTKEAYAFVEKERIPRTWNYRVDNTDRRPGIWPLDNKADDPSLHNPLLRLERMGCGWFGAIFEWEGVIVEDNPDLEHQAWLTLAQEEGKSPPPAFTLKRIEGMKNEQAISEVLCWSRDQAELRRLASRKEEISQGLRGGVYRLRSGSREFVDVLVSNEIPMALVSTRPKKTLETAMRAIGIEGVFSVIVGAEDVHRGKPDPEMFLYAVGLLKFIPERCIVFGNSNQTVEAAHDARMKCVAVASKHPVYELRAADLVVRHLDELSMVDLKNLAAVESPEFQEPELEMEEEFEESSQTTEVDDTFW